MDEFMGRFPTPEERVEQCNGERQAASLRYHTGTFK